VPERNVVMAVPLDTRPVALQQAMPPWWPTDPVTRRTAFSGVVRVHVGADGRVESAELVRPIHPRYDPVLLKAARGWLYEPARRNDVPIAADLNVEVTLRPTQ
jgi:TonB family protein